tara:strand:+ start:8250 stop:9479 length:1230 start_codon:yes stop_codon:yes gene_type:complete
MLKLEDVVTLINLKEIENIEYLVGNKSIILSPIEPYDNLVIEFINELSITLRNHKNIRDYPDIMAFAFWCRSSNIKKIKNSFKENNVTRIGLGLVFHVTPSNVPVNFAFSYIFGLLSGNSNIVRVPSKPFDQIKIICNAIVELFKKNKYKLIKETTSFINYERDDEITGLISLKSDARLIWGGDETISNIKKLPTRSRCIDICFADRYSFSLISSDSILEISDKEMNLLVEGFYNDTYLMDQNACSSPHLIIWLGKNKEDAQNRFWKCLYGLVQKKYDIADIMALDKYLLFCENAIDLEEIREFEQYGNYIYILKLNSLFKDIDNYPGKFGYFFQYDASNLDELSSIINMKYQTLTYHGVDKNDIKDLILEKSLQGIDRIVPVGKALDMDVIWDGYDVIRSLSRIIDVR